MNSSVSICLFLSVLSLFVATISFDYPKPKPPIKFYIVTYSFERPNGVSGIGRASITITNPTHDLETLTCIESSIVRDWTDGEKPTKLFVTGIITP